MFLTVRAYHLPPFLPGTRSPLKASAISEAQPLPGGWRMDYPPEYAETPGLPLPATSSDTNAAIGN